MDLDHRVSRELYSCFDVGFSVRISVGIGIEAVVAYVCFGVVNGGKWEWDGGRCWCEEVAYAVVLCVSAARSRSNTGYDPEKEFVRRECEFTSSNSRLYPMSVYIAYNCMISRFYPFLPFLFPFSFLVRVLTTSPPTQQLPFHTQWQDLFRQAGTILSNSIPIPTSTPPRPNLTHSSFAYAWRVNSYAYADDDA